jgi:hypothetical protein
MAAPARPYDKFVWTSTRGIVWPWEPKLMKPSLDRQYRQPA